MYVLEIITAFLIDILTLFRSGKECGGKERSNRFDIKRPTKDASY